MMSSWKVTASEPPPRKRTYTTRGSRSIPPVGSVQVVYLATRNCDIGENPPSLETIIEVAKLGHDARTFTRGELVNLAPLLIEIPGSDVGGRRRTSTIAEDVSTRPPVRVTRTPTERRPGVENVVVVFPTVPVEVS
jgi:hypothetical protein